MARRTAGGDGGSRAPVPPQGVLRPRRRTGRRTLVLVAVVSAAVAAVVSAATTAFVLRLDADRGRPAALVTATTGTATAARPVADNPAPAAGPLDLVALYDRVGSGVVRVETTACVLGGAGSGFLVAADLVATAAHVVDGAHGVVLRRDDGTEVAAAVVGLDTVHDVALLRTARPVPGHVFAFAGAPPAVGADVAALGYPGDGPLVPVRRTVTALGQSLDVGAASAAAGGTTAATGSGERDGVVDDLVRVDGGFRAGASGGPVVDADGRVVGIVEGRSVDDASGYAVAATRAAPLVASWRSQTTALDVARPCDVPVGTSRSRVVVRDASAEGLGDVVTGLFGAYASAVNSARYEEAWGMLAGPARGGRTLADWAQGERTRQLFDAVVRQVRVLSPGTSPTTRTPPPPTGTPSAASPPSPASSAATPVRPVVVPGEGGRLAAVVDFSSTQDEAGSQTCTRWRVTYTLVRSGGRWLIEAVVPAAGFPQDC